MSDYLDPSNIVFEEPEERNFVVFPKGIYKFTIIEINTMTTAKTSGTPMLPIKLLFERADGDTTQVYENILFSKAAEWKLLQFLKCVCGDAIKSGKIMDFNSPDFLAWLKRKGGTARLKVADVKGKDYQRNEVEAFIFSASEETPAPRKTTPKPSPVETPADEDDDIPF